MLEVAVHGEDEISLSMVKAGCKGGGLAKVAAQLDDKDAAVNCRDLLE
jgi:hypothetical protein